MEIFTSVSGYKLVEELNHELEHNDVKLHSVSYEGIIPDHGSRFSASYSLDEKNDSPQAIGLARGTGSELEAETDYIEELADVEIIDVEVAEVGVNSVGADNRWESIMLYKVEGSEGMHEIDSEDLFYDLQVQLSPWEEYFE